MTATGGTAWIFTGWSGSVSGTTSPLGITMDANKSVTANFIAGVNITVSKQGQGTVSPGSAVYPKNVPVTFTATPATGWRWDHWEGSLAGSTPGDPSVTVPMTVAGNLKAFFVEQATLTMVKTLVGNLPAEGGTVSPAVGETKYDKGQVVSLSATQDAGWRFKQWSGGASGTNPSTTVTMSANKTVTATFIQRHTVTAESQFHGIVTPESGTWDHGQSASFKWEREANFSVYQFTHWGGLPDSFSTTEWGPGTSDQTTVSVPINDSYHLIAYDEPVIVLLTAEVDADGCTGCTVDPAVVTTYERDTDATVTATPGAGWGFVRWDGDVPASKEEDNPLVLTMDEDKEVTAVMKEEFELTIDKIGEGTVDPDVGTYTYLDGETATLSATAAEEWIFSHWSGLSETDYPDGPAGAGTSSDNPLHLVMVRDETITANFVSGCMVMWPSGGTSGSALMAVSELEPETEAELVSITFTSDLPVLHDDDGTFGNVGALFSGPEWTWGAPSHPILCAMDSTLTASVDVIVSPAGIPFTLIGEGSDGWSTFEGTGVATGEQQSIAVAAQVALPHALAKYNASIEWRVEFCTTPQDLVSTEQTIYSTYGPPDVPDIYPWLDDHKPTTVTRVEFLVDAASNSPSIAYSDVGAAIAAAIGSKKPLLLAQPQSPSLWKILDPDGNNNYSFECVSGRDLATTGVTMLGVPQTMVRWKDCDGCAAYPSTDNATGIGYYSNCTDVEEPNAYCLLPFICGMTPVLHPDHTANPVHGKPHASGPCPSTTFPMLLRFGGGQGAGGALGSPAENFFKIHDLGTGYWYYISVVPSSDPLIGSVSLGDEMDRGARYQIMKHSQGTGYAGQHWHDGQFPAPPLP